MRQGVSDSQQAYVATCETEVHTQQGINRELLDVIHDHMCLVM